MIIYSFKHKHNIFEDYIYGLTVKPGDKSVIWNEDDIVIDDEHDIVIFMQVVPNQGNQIIFKNTKHVNVFVLNTEQMSKNLDAFLFNIKHFIDYAKEQNITFGICDYSEENIDVFRKTDMVKGLPIHYIPYQYSEKDLQFLKAAKEEKHLACMCGVMGERRKSIVKHVAEEYNIDITVAHGFRKVRDECIAKHKLLVNISAADEYTIYEHIRCDRVIFTGIPILSEKKTSYENLDITEFVTWCERDELGDMILEILGNYDEYTKKLDKEKLGKIIANRKQIYDDFRNKYEL